MSNYSRIILFAFVASVLVNQVFSIECYTCETLPGGECDTNPKQNKFITDCDKLGSFKSRESDVFSTASLMSNIKYNSTGLGTGNLAGIEFDCMKVTGKTRLGQNTVARTCGMKQVTCQEFSELALAKIGYKVDTCSRCSSNLCNSSDNLKIGIWSFAITAVVALATVM